MNYYYYSKKDGTKFKMNIDNYEDEIFMKELMDKKSDIDFKNWLYNKYPKDTLSHIEKRYMCILKKYEISQARKKYLLRKIKNLYEKMRIDNIFMKDKLKAFENRLNYVRKIYSDKLNINVDENDLTREKMEKKNEERLELTKKNNSEIFNMLESVEKLNNEIVNVVEDINNIPKKYEDNGLDFLVDL